MTPRSAPRWTTDVRHSTTHSRASCAVWPAGTSRPEKTRSTGAPHHVRHFGGACRFVRQHEVVAHAGAADPEPGSERQVLDAIHLRVGRRCRIPLEVVARRIYG